MEKQALRTIDFILVLLVVAIAEGFFVNLARANPYMYYEHVDPPAGATPLVVSVASPKNHAIYNVNDVAVTFSVSTEGTSIGSIYGVYFNTNWLKGNVTVYKQNSQSPEFPKFWSYDETFWDLPDGNYNVEIIAWGGGGYAKGMTAYSYSMTTISVVNFTIATPPEVSVLSPLNITYDSSDVQLNFTVNKEPSLIQCSLDGEKNSTIYGNTTLTELANGEHNLAIYVRDVDGNLGVSETVAFTIAKPKAFEMSLVIAPVASVIVASIGIVVYFRKRKS